MMKKHSDFTASSRSIDNSFYQLDQQVDNGFNNDAEDLLAEFGYKQELNRTFGTLQVFGIAFSIMGLLPSIATVMGIGLTGGMFTLLWGWFISGFMILTMGIAMSELASAIPTSGGLYYWTHHFAPPGWKNILSFVVGISNSMALIGGVCSITYGLAEQILAAIYLATDGGFILNDLKVYCVFVLGIIAELLVTSFASSAISKLQTTSIIANIGLIVLFFIALPTGTAKNSQFNDSSFIFKNFQNFSDWPSGWAFIQFGLGGCAWVVSGFDSCIHMAEEVKNPSRAIPFGIIGSIATCWITGFVILIVIGACINPDLKSIIDSATGQPLAQIFYDSLGKNWAVVFISLSAVCQFFMSASALTATSRQVWAFSRDDGLPFSWFIKVVHKELKVPLRATIVCALFSLVIGLLILAGPVAANALFSIGIIGNYLSWSTPQVLRLISGNGSFKPGCFYLGDRSSPIVVTISIFSQYLIMILSFFPSRKHITDASQMNYAVVINVGIWVLSIVYFYAVKSKTFVGPKPNIPEDEFIEGVEPIIDATFQAHERDSLLKKNKFKMII